MNIVSNTPLSNFYQDAERLDNRSLDALIAHFVSIRLRREHAGMSTNEAMLLKKINKGLPLAQQQRFDYLRQRQQEGVLQEDEFLELSSLLENLERLNVNRIKYITALAAIRKVSVRELMQQLGITPSISQIH